MAIFNIPNLDSALFCFTSCQNRNFYAKLFRTVLSAKLLSCWFAQFTSFIFLKHKAALLNEYLLKSGVNTFAPGLTFFKEALFMHEYTKGGSK
jgi:hypothetical protein